MTAPEHALFVAIAGGDLAGVVAALDGGARAGARRSYEERDRFDTYEVEETALLMAIGRGDVEIVRALLARGADPNDFGGARGVRDTPLDTAIRLGRGDATLGAILLDAGATATPAALIQACRSGAEPLAERMLDGGLDVNLREGATSPLIAAAGAGATALVERLIARGADLARDGATALYHAANHGHLAVIDLLLARGVAADTPVANGWTPVMAARWQTHPEVARRLIDAGADPGRADDTGKTVDDWIRERRR